MTLSGVIYMATRLHWTALLCCGVIQYYPVKTGISLTSERLQKDTEIGYHDSCFVNKIPYLDSSEIASYLYFCFFALRMLYTNDVSDSMASFCLNDQLD